MNIGPVVRASHLPNSVAPNRTATVQVSIDPPLDGEHVTFKVIGESNDSGTATVVGNPQLSASGEIEVQGGHQTAPGHPGGLRIRAVLKGGQVAESPPFSVCAHPEAVEYQFIGEVNDDPNRFGILLQVIIVSDSGQNQDLGEVQEKEIVSADYGHSATLHGVAAETPDQNQHFHPALAVPPDRHTVGKVTTRAKDYHRLHGAEGRWSNDQLDVFICPRCGIEEPGAVIQKSGYRLTRTIFTEAGQLRVRFRKEPMATNVRGFQAEPGTTAIIERVLEAPTVALPPLPNEEG